MSKKDRLPKDEYFTKRYNECIASGHTDKAEYYKGRLEQLGAAADIDPIDPTERLKAFIEDRNSQLSRSIVATPSDAYLDSFAKANQGASDPLLVQMAKQRGYQMCMEDIAEIMNLETEEA